MMDHYRIWSVVDGNDAAVQQWQLVDRVVQQISLQTKDGDPDHAPLEIDVKKVVRQ